MASRPSAVREGGHPFVYVRRRRRGVVKKKIVVPIDQTPSTPRRRDARSGGPSDGAIEQLLSIASSVLGFPRDAPADRIWSETGVEIKSSTQIEWGKLYLVDHRPVGVCQDESFGSGSDQCISAREGSSVGDSHASVDERAPDLSAVKAGPVRRVPKGAKVAGRPAAGGASSVSKPRSEGGSRKQPPLSVMFAAEAGGIEAGFEKAVLDGGYKLFDLGGVEISKAVCDAVEKAFAAAGGDGRMRLVVVGPRGSGKTLLLTCLARRVLEEFVFRGLWRQVLLVRFDFRGVVITEAGALLACVVRAVLTALEVQWPLLGQVKGDRPLRALVEECLLGAWSEGRASVGLSGRFPRNGVLDDVAEEVNAIASELRDRIGDWDAVTALPALLARAFGFESVIFIGDHVDVLDAFAGNVNVLAQFEALLATGYFIISCEDEDRLLDVLGDSAPFAEFFSTLDVGGAGDETDVVLMLRFENGQALALEAAACGGAPAFVAQWQQIAARAETLDGLQDRERRREEVEILSLLRPLVAALLGDKRKLVGFELKRP